MSHVYVLATVLSVLFLWVWKKVRSNFIHHIFSDLLLTGAFLLKMQAATLKTYTTSIWSFSMVVP